MGQVAWGMRQADRGRRSEPCSGVGSAQCVEKWNRRDDVDVGVVDVQVQKMRVVADKMRCASVRGAQQESDIVLVDRIVAEVEMFYGDDFGEKGELPHKIEDDGFVDATLAKLEGILRSGVTGNEKDEPKNGDES
jgi:hypothetical protein